MAPCIWHSLGSRLTASVAVDAAQTKAQLPVFTRSFLDGSGPRPAASVAPYHRQLPQTRLAAHIVPWTLSATPEPPVRAAPHRRGASCQMPAGQGPPG